MNIIFKNKKCQAFDPMMVLPEKTRFIIDNPMRANTSCVAPAYIFLKGSRGTRYLCDYHFQYEKLLTMQRTPELWSKISKIKIDNRRQISKTFAKKVKTKKTLNHLCWCGGKSYVLIKHKKNKNIIYLCNFHYRKTYFRHYSNNIIFEKIYTIIDERYKMNISVIEEMDQIEQI
jgi:hypothetical protein